MNLGVLQPLPPQSSFRITRPVKVSPTGNLYKINIGHYGGDDQHVRNYEVWTTKEAVQQHFAGMTGEPKDYQLQRFARRVYEDRLRVSNRQPAEKAVLVSSTQKVHGNPAMWPQTIRDPEVKV